NSVVVVQNFPCLGELVPLPRVIWGRQANSVAYIGGICHERGIREMVEAMSLMPDRLDVTLKLAGEFNPIWVRNEVIRLPGWKRVEELGFLERPKVLEVLREARAGLVLIHPEPRYQVAYPIKMFEYMAAGIPVIASDFPLWRQIVEGAGCGLLV